MGEGSRLLRASCVMRIVFFSFVIGESLILNSLVSCRRQVATAVFAASYALACPCSCGGNFSNCLVHRSLVMKRVLGFSKMAGLILASVAEGGRSLAGASLASVPENSACWRLSAQVYAGEFLFSVVDFTCHSNVLARNDASSARDDGRDVLGVATHCYSDSAGKVGPSGGGVDQCPSKTIG
jgi:hypothetical protein